MRTSSKVPRVPGVPKVPKVRCVMNVDEYLAGPEEMRRRELVWGVVHEPQPEPVSHQMLVGCALMLLAAHVRERRLGAVCVSPCDVVLDKEKALVVQPDLFFISTGRMSIVRDQVWGAPDLAVEVASPGTARYDRTTKIGWYRTYGVRECWLIDAVKRVVTIVNLSATGEDASRSFSGGEQVASRVLPEFRTPAREFFE
jgi:Uma2 family endonuclease